MRLQIQNLKVFDFSLRVAGLRYGVIVLLSLFNAHLRFGLVPFSNGYQFPSGPFSNGLLFGLIICTSSWLVTNIFKASLFADRRISMRNTLLFLGINAIAAVFVYILLYAIKFGFPTNVQNFSLYLFVTLSVILIENLIFLLYCTLINNADLNSDIGKRNHADILIPIGNRKIKVSTDNILCIEMKNGIVVIHTSDEGKLNTQFQTLDELEESLPDNNFYRVNRQTILNRDAIWQVKNDINRKLKILLTDSLSNLEVSVSRYKRKELMSWIENG